MSKKLWFTVILLLVLNQGAWANQKIVNINDINWPPYFFIDNQTKKYTLGIGKEILNHCIKQAGYEINYIRLPIKRTHHYMKQGVLDITVYSYNKSREDFLLYSYEPIFSSEYGFLVRADSNIEINTIDDVRPYQIGHLAGLTYSPEYLEIVNEKIAKKEVTISHSLEAMFHQLLAPNPRFNIMADSKATFHWFAQKTGVTEQVKVLDFTMKNKDYFITISKRSKNIANGKAFLIETDNCLKNLKKDGGYQAILNRYQG